MRHMIPRPLIFRFQGTKVADGFDKMRAGNDKFIELYDEEVPREGVHITRQRRLTRWTEGSTWLWTSLRNQLGAGEGASGLQFDQLLDPSETMGAQ